ncbi:Uncharacterised protein [Candidatus Burarchaeum australiense]|nr:Uncharacterised protein [Candidatus Burarchaeum australiense]
MHAIQETWAARVQPSNGIAATTTAWTTACTSCIPIARAATIALTAVACSAAPTNAHRARQAARHLSRDGTAETPAQIPACTKFTRAAARARPAQEERATTTRAALFPGTRFRYPRRDTARVRGALRTRIHSHTRAQARFLLRARWELRAAPCRLASLQARPERKAAHTPQQGLPRTPHAAHRLPLMHARTSAVQARSSAVAILCRTAPVIQRAAATIGDTQSRTA